jgi:hypothetical protein
METAEKSFCWPRDRKTELARQHGLIASLGRYARIRAKSSTGMEMEDSIILEKRN